MNKETINCHQFGIIASVLLLTLKFTSLPALLYECNNVGGVVSISVIVVINVLFIILLFWLKNKYKNLGIYEILSNGIGTLLTKAIYFIFFVFFIFKLLSIMSDGYGFIRDVVDEEFTHFNFLICFIPVCCALAFSGLRSIGRTAEFFFPYVVVGLIVSIMFSFVPVKLWGIGTLAHGTFSGLFRSITELSFWNGDMLAMLIFIDKIQIDKRQIKRFIFPYVTISFLLVITYLVYYSLYQQTSLFHNNLIYDIVQYAIGTSSGWHMDIFAILIFIICLIIQGGIFIYSARDCVEKIFNYNNKTITLISVIMVLIFTEFLFLDDYLEYVVYARMWLSWFGGFVMLIIPALFCVLTITRGGKNARH